MAICSERAVHLALAFLLCCFYFGAVLVVGVHFPFVFGTGHGIRLYRFLIIVFLSVLPQRYYKIWDI